MRPAGIYTRYDLMTIFHSLLTSDFGQFSLVKCMQVGDLHFMVQWFCHILTTILWMNVVTQTLT